MSIPAFDTQKAVKAFTQAGFDDKQAEAVVTTMNDVMSQNLATRADFRVLESDMKKTVEKCHSDLEQSIGKVRIDLEQSIGKVRIDLEQSIEKVRSDLEQSIEKVRIDLEQSIEKVHSDLEQSIEKVRIDLEQRIERLQGKLESGLAKKFETLYRHLWVMGIGIVMLNVSLVALVMFIMVRL